MEAEDHFWLWIVVFAVLTCCVVGANAPVMQADPLHDAYSIVPE